MICVSGCDRLRRAPPIRVAALPASKGGARHVVDADELLREDAKSRVGQALSRLLNLGDGIT